MSLTPVCLPSVRQTTLMRIQQQSRAQSTGIMALKKEQYEQRSKIGEQRRLIAEQERKLQEQAKLITEMTGHIHALEKNMELVAQTVAAYTGQQVVLRDTPQLPEICVADQADPQSGGSPEKEDGSDCPLAGAGKAAGHDTVWPETSGSSVTAWSCVGDAGTETEERQTVRKKQKSAVGDLLDEMLSQPKTKLLEVEAAESEVSRAKGKGRKRGGVRLEGTTSTEELLNKRRRR